jgi:RNA polymerase sigma-70 factor, ECF subfamily
MDDTQAFEAFMRDYQNMVFSTAMRLVANAAEAEDIAQETFLKAYAHFAGLRESPSAGGWLKTVATNLSLNHLARYRSRWSFFSELFAPSDTAEETEPNFATDDDFDTRLLEQERSNFVDEALQNCLRLSACRSCSSIWRGSATKTLLPNSTFLSAK